MPCVNSRAHNVSTQPSALCAAAAGASNSCKGPCTSHTAACIKALKHSTGPHTLHQVQPTGFEVTSTAAPQHRSDHHLLPTEAYTAASPHNAPNNVFGTMPQVALQFGRPLHHASCNGQQIPVPQILSRSGGLCSHATICAAGGLICWRTDNEDATVTSLGFNVAAKPPPLLQTICC